MFINHKVIGEGYPVVMLHGWSLDHQVLLHSMEPLFEKRTGWKRVYVDLPGMGRSDSHPSIRNSDDMLKTVLEWLDDLIPNQPFILCGNSYGGYIARGIIHLRHEMVRGLLLMAPMVVPEFDSRTLPQQTVLKIDNELMSQLSSDDLDEFRSMAVLQGESEWDRFRDEILMPSKQSNYEFLNRIRENGYGFTFDISSNSFEYPSLIVTGRQDHVVGYQDAWQLIEQYPRATFAVLDMAGHNLQIEQASVFNVLVNDWLDRLESEVF
ncbi:alpha/beta fold hydrolase [Alicyclobacillus dauci]|uniref:Alpha/beta hydrolase n=1 Tax=Alicyclobacillus dauci TaxID=1475485 RepID=A0ABY6Z1Z7_9BACL|nr:alpha/beta hydrolase [Alicyclobacillus dauci]WAH36759.1 alpha/beta hydrolase [Alicyclobacillus dauci]